ncbi:MAG: dephospho-CoA kinase [SAR202 cluster bacterium]|jgi:dephospho-CoA kinase|nr:dephospho-CoA kinase [SAR202 cluster bacterium]MDP6511922.1 dephospho-CoA kinase [SAR202 cluster bacterium]MDP6714886.1 dephospho-CoA kinase [SAR202 cluster bacterium]
MVLVIGVTGSIATGKSTACDVIVDQGAHHCDADRLVHRLYDPGTDAFDRIVGIFGEEIVGEDGYIDRRILGGKVFGKPEEMNKLTTAIGSINDAVHAVVDEWRDTLGPDDVALMEAVNLIEAGYGQWCDQIWLFACEQDIARQRLADRNQLSSEEVEKRLSSQRSWEDRAIASDIVMMNNGTQDDFIQQVRNQYRSIVQLAQVGELEPSRFHGWWKEQVREREAQNSDKSD